MKATIKVHKNNGNGNATALEIPAGMTGKELQRMLRSKKNKDIIDSAKAAAVTSESTQVIICDVPAQEEEQTAEDSAEDG